MCQVRAMRKKWMVNGNKARDDKKKKQQDHRKQIRKRSGC